MIPQNWELEPRPGTAVIIAEIELTNVQCCGSGFNESGSRSRVLMIRKKYVLDQILQFTVKATGEALSPQKRTSITSKNEIC